MAKSFASLPILCLCLCLCFLVLVFNEGNLGFALEQASGQAGWCVAKPSASDQELINNINYVCDSADCSIIQPGGPCFEPQNLINHASVVMNLYYQQKGRNYWNCDFTQSGLTVVTDPSRKI
ncbi:hypothetical protein RJ640_025763 [Escallonia rubra]|uniref:X8 domain-containing protein n=1 Tax=Escallonia rubra TaxID=112253 RepID=A0AA88UI56_9ASTE|nr:hypothetical protein RJ640_025763 [Escallonia rubra]